MEKINKQTEIDKDHDRFCIFCKMFNSQMNFATIILRNKVT